MALTQETRTPQRAAVPDSPRLMSSWGKEYPEFGHTQERTALRSPRLPFRSLLTQNLAQQKAAGRLSVS